MKPKSSMPLLKFGLPLLLSAAVLGYVASRRIPHPLSPPQGASPKVLLDPRAKPLASAPQPSLEANGIAKDKMLCPPDYVKEEFESGGPVTRTWEQGVDSYEGCLGTLRLQFKDGSERRLVDTRVSDPPPDTDYRFIKHFKAEGLFAVEKIQYREVVMMELWSEANGSQTELYCSLPEFSPNHLWFHSYCTDLGAGYNTNSLGIWSLSDGIIKEAFKIEDTAWGSGSLQWVNDETLAFSKLTISSEGEEVEAGKGRVQRLEGVWKILEE